jgi:cytochrome c5
MRKLTVLAVVILFALAVSAQGFAKGHRSGEQLWEDVCLGCHDTGMMDAPLGGSGEFKDRLAKKGMDKLVENAMKGINDMPVKGSCTDCSESEIRAAIKFMIEM